VKRQEEREENGEKQIHSSTRQHTHTIGRTLLEDFTIKDTYGDYDFSIDETAPMWCME
jgi:hypothetical protein